MHSCSLMIGLDKCDWSCNAVDDLSTKICVLSKTKAVNIEVFNMITRKNEPKIFLKLISCDFKCKFSGTVCNSNQK